MLRIFSFSILIALMATLFSCGGSTTDKPKTMLDSLNMVLKEDSNNAVALNARARIFLDQKKFPQALLDIGRAVEIDSTKADFFITLADVHMIMKNSGKAKSALEKSVSLDPKNTTGLLKLGELYLYVEDYQKAIDYSNQALQVDNHMPRGYFTKGMAYLLSGDTTRANASFLTTVEQDPEYLVAYEELGRIASARSDALAEQYFKNALKINSSDVNIHYLLGEFYQNAGRDDEAIAEYSAITKLMPGNRAAHYNIGYINFVYKLNYEEATKHFNDAINADPKYADAFYMRGLCSEKLKDKGAAEADFRMALQIDPANAKAKDGLKRLGK